MFSLIKNDKVCSIARPIRYHKTKEELEFRKLYKAQLLTLKTLGFRDGGILSIFKDIQHFVTDAPHMMDS